MDIEKVRSLRLDPQEGDAPKRVRSSTGRWLVLSCLIAGLSFAGGWWVRPVTLPGGGVEAPPEALQSVAHTPSGLGRNFTAAGYIEPEPPYPVKVTSLVSGRLELFEVLEGVPVEAGQVIARVDSTALERQAEVLQAALAVNAAQIEYAGSVASRAGRLADIGSVSRREAEQADAERSVLEAERRRLSEELAGVQWQVDNTRIRAPVTGVVFERFAHSGQWVGPGHLPAIASIYDPRRLQVWVDVNQRDAARVRVGQRVEVVLEAEPGRTFPGRVDRILPRASIAKNTFQAKIALEETSGSLRPDMSVHVTFLSPTEGGGEADGGRHP